MGARRSNRLLVAVTTALAAGLLSAFANPFPAVERTASRDGMMLAQTALETLHKACPLELDWDRAPVATATFRILQ